MEKAINAEKGTNIGGGREFCANYRRGHCNRGDACKYSHDVQVGLSKANVANLIAEAQKNVANMGFGFSAPGAPPALPPAPVAPVAPAAPVAPVAPVVPAVERVERQEPRWMWRNLWAPLRAVELLETSDAMATPMVRPGEVLRSAEVGIRVRRGPDWEWHDQDGGGLGTTVEGSDRDGWVFVKWDAHGREYNYRVERSYDLIVDQSSFLSSAEVGVRVRAAPGWEWGDQDGGGLGTTVEASGPGWVRVRWDHGNTNGYQVGANDTYDLIIAQAPSAQPGEVLRSAQAGVRVRRGPGWSYSDQDGGAGGLGITTGEGRLGVRVRWDWDHGSSEGRYSYRIGPHRFDLIVVGVPGREQADAAEQAPSHTTTSAEPDGGYDEQWLDVAEAASMQCPICMCVARNAMAHDCGNLFCEICWIRWMAEDNPTCPVCRELGEGIVRAPRDRRKISNLMIRCQGCKESIRLADKEKHVSQCPKLVPRSEGAEGGYDLVIDSSSPLSASPSAPREVLRTAEAGVRVMRGPDWEWGEQDGGGFGTTETDPSQIEGWVTVRWDHDGSTNSYRVGRDGMHDLIVAEGHRGLGAEGPDWDWDDQDGGGPGTTVPGADEDGWVSVRWDAGSEFKYRVGAGGNYDLIIDGASSPASPAAARILRCAEADVRVRRGRDWKWGDQDAGGLGVTLGMDGVGPGWVTVRWDQSGARGAYRVGAFGKFDLFVVEADGAAAQQEVQGAGGVSPQVSSDADQELMIEISAATAAAYSRASSAAVSAASSHMSAPSEPLQPVPHPDGGHDEQWLDVAEANSMQCPICMCVARDALAHDCGNLFCDLCWTRWIAENPSCPVCREDGQGIVRAPRDQRKILNLMIRCPLGCDETFRLGDKETHDHGGLGTTIQGDTEEGWVRVRWDLGGENSYRVGERGKYDLIVDATSPPYARPVPGEVLRTAEAGIRVRRGPDWDWGDQDGGGLGTTEADSDPGWVTVKWDHSGRTNSYRVGKEGNYDLIVAELESHIRVGDRVRFTQEAGDVSFSGCPGRTLAFSVGDTYVVREVREGWFTTRQWENLWAPLGAVEPDTAAEAASEPSSSGQRPAAAPAAAPSESLEAGHDEQWLDPAEATSMQCAICLSVARNALAHDCGNLFCELCWTRWVAENPSCPVCREAGDTIVKAPRDRRKILNLMVRCPLGCEETFRLGDKETHVSHCAKRAVTCCHCGEEVLADQISIHEKDRLKRRRFDVE
eukprot:g31824.t1